MFARRLQRRLLSVALLATIVPGAAPVAGEAVVVELPAPRLDGAVALERALSTRRSVREYAKRPLPLADLAQLVWAAQGVTSPRGFRTAPSAGALYPLEIFVVAGNVEGLGAGAYRYRPRDHRLERHAEGDLRKALSRAALEQDWVAEAPAIVVVAGVYERSRRKYGRRAPRYVHMEVGHASQNLYLQAEALGLGTCAVGAFRDRELANALRLPSNMVPLLVHPVGWPAPK